MKQQVARASTNTAILTAAGQVAVANYGRQLLRIQNLGTNPLFVKLGDNASTTDFTFVLPANTVADNGTSAPKEVTYQGNVSVAGTTPRLLVSEDFS